MTIDLKAFIGLVKKKFWRLAVFVILVAGLSLGGSFLVQKRYAASSVLFIKGSQMTDFLPQQMMPIMGMLPQSSMSSDYLETLLNSETVSWTVIEKLDLAENPNIVEKKIPDSDKEKREKILKLFRQCVSVSTNVNGEINLRVETPDAELSAMIANELVNEVVERGENEKVRNAETLKTLKDEVQALVVDIEDQLIKMQVDDEDLLMANTQTMNMIDTLADLNAKKLMSRIKTEQIEALLKKPGSSQVAASLNRGLIESKTELREYEKITGDFQEKLREMPPAMQKFVRLKKELAFNEQLYNVILSRYHSMVINMEMGETEVEIIDVAVPQYHKVKPKRMQYLVFGAFAGIFLGFLSLVVFGREEFIVMDAPGE